MAFDLAIDSFGDLRIAPNNDLEVVTGAATVDQRIRVRLKVYGGEWELDPSGGALGSHVRDSLRLPIERAQETLKYMVREALEPMDDIRVVDVITAPSAEDSRSIDMTILYSMVDDGEASDDVLTMTLTIEG